MPRSSLQMLGWPQGMQHQGGGVLDVGGRGAGLRLVAGTLPGPVRRRMRVWLVAGASMGLQAMGGCVRGVLQIRTETREAAGQDPRQAGMGYRFTTPAPG